MSHSETLSNPPLCPLISRDAGPLDRAKVGQWPAPYSPEHACPLGHGWGALKKLLKATQRRHSNSRLLHWDLHKSKNQPLFQLPQELHWESRGGKHHSGKLSARAFQWCAHLTVTQRLAPTAAKSSTFQAVFDDAFHQGGPQWAREKVQTTPLMPGNNVEKN